MSREDIVTYCRNLYEQYSKSQYRQDKLKEIRDGRKRYKEILGEKTFPFKGCSNKTLGLEQIAVDTLEPRIKAQLVNTDEDFVLVEPVGPSDVEKAEYVTRIMHWILKCNMDFTSEVSRQAHDVLMDGTIFIIPRWEEDFKSNYVRFPVPSYSLPDGTKISEREAQMMGVPMSGVEERINERVDLAFKCELDVVRAPDAFLPDVGGDWWSQPFLRYIYPTYDYLKANSGEDGPYFDITEDMMDRAGMDTLTDDDDEARADLNVSYSLYTRVVRLLECYVTYEGSWYIVTLHPESGYKPVRFQQMSDVYWHNRKPVFRVDIFRESNESLGTGIPTKIKHYSTGADDLYNQMIDAGTMEIIPFGFVKGGIGIDSRDLEISVGRLIPLPEGCEVAFPNIRVKSVIFLKFLEALMGFMERKLSLSDWTMGAAQGGAGRGAETFRGMSLVTQEGNIKHAYQGERLREQYEKILTDVRLLYAQNMPYDAMMKVAEDGNWHFEPINCLDLQGNFDVKIQISDASANKMVNRNEKMALINVLAQHPLTNPEKTFDEILKAFGIRQNTAWKDPRVRVLIEALKRAPELPQVVEEYMMQKQQKMEDQKVASEATRNVRRQAIEREIEKPGEDSKLLDQVIESVKKKIMKDGIMPPKAEGENR